MEDSPPLRPQLDRLFGDADRFVDHYGSCRLLRHHTGGFDDLFGIELADRLIGSGVLQVPFDARMANAVDDAGTTTEEKWREAMRGINPERFDPDAAVAGFDAGDTIILHALHRRLPAVDEFAFGLECEIGQMIDVNAFLTPPGAQGLEPHYDHHDVIILQVHGTKCWSLWEPTVRDPLPEYAPEQFETNGTRHEVTMAPGDVLYIPRGWTHAATTTTETSLHLTVGIIPIPWLEVAHGFLCSLDAEPGIRRSLPLGYHRDPALLLEGIGDTIDLVTGALRRCDIQLAAKELGESFVPRNSTAVGRLSEVVGARSRIENDTVVRLGSRSRSFLANEALGLPAPLRDRLEALRGGRTTELRNIVGPISDESRRLVAQLMRHGALTPVYSSDGAER